MLSDPDKRARYDNFENAFKGWQHRENEGAGSNRVNGFKDVFGVAPTRNHDQIVIASFEALLSVHLLISGSIYLPCSGCHSEFLLQSHHALER